MRSSHHQTPKVFTTAMFGDPFPEYVSPALIALVAKHAPTELDLFDNLVQSTRSPKPATKQRIPTDGGLKSSPKFLPKVEKSNVQDKKQSNVQQQSLQDKGARKMKQRTPQTNGDVKSQLKPVLERPKSSRGNPSQRNSSVPGNKPSTAPVKSLVPFADLIQSNRAENTRKFATKCVKERGALRTASSENSMRPRSCSNSSHRKPCREESSLFQTDSASDTERRTIAVSESYPSLDANIKISQTFSKRASVNTSLSSSNFSKRTDSQHVPKSCRRESQPKKIVSKDAPVPLSARSNARSVKSARSKKPIKRQSSDDDTGPVSSSYKERVKQFDQTLRSRMKSKYSKSNFKDEFFQQRPPWDFDFSIHSFDGIGPWFGSPTTKQQEMDAPLPVPNLDLDNMPKMMELDWENSMKSGTTSVRCFRSSILELSPDKKILYPPTSRDSGRDKISSGQKNLQSKPKRQPVVKKASWKGGVLILKRPNRSLATLGIGPHRRRQTVAERFLKNMRKPAKVSTNEFGRGCSSVRTSFRTPGYSFGKERKGILNNLASSSGGSNAKMEYERRYKTRVSPYASNNAFTRRRSIDTQKFSMQRGGQKRKQKDDAVLRKTVTTLGFYRTGSSLHGSKKLRQCFTETSDHSETSCLPLIKDFAQQIVKRVDAAASVLMKEETSRNTQLEPVTMGKLPVFALYDIPDSSFYVPESPPSVLESSPKHVATLKQLTGEVSDNNIDCSLSAVSSVHTGKRDLTELEQAGVFGMNVDEEDPANSKLIDWNADREDKNEADDELVLLDQESTFQWGLNQDDATIGLFDMSPPRLVQSRIIKTSEAGNFTTGDEILAAEDGLSLSDATGGDFLLDDFTMDIKLPNLDRLKRDKKDELNGRPSKVRKEEWSLPVKGDPLSVINIYTKRRVFRERDHCERHSGVEIHEIEQADEKEDQGRSCLVEVDNSSINSQLVVPPAGTEAVVVTLRNEKEVESDEKIEQLVDSTAEQHCPEKNTSDNSAGLREVCSTSSNSHVSHRNKKPARSHARLSVEMKKLKRMKNAVNQSHTLTTSGNRRWIYSTIVESISRKMEEEFLQYISQPQQARLLKMKPHRFRKHEKICPDLVSESGRLKSHENEESATGIAQKIPNGTSSTTSLAEEDTTEPESRNSGIDRFFLRNPRIQKKRKCRAVVSSINQETRKIEWLEKDIVRKRREAHQWRLKWKRHLLETEMKKLDAEINETRTRILQNVSHFESYQPQVQQVLAALPSGNGQQRIDHALNVSLGQEFGNREIKEDSETGADTTNYSESFVSEDAFSVSARVEYQGSRDFSVKNGQPADIVYSVSLKPNEYVEGRAYSVMSGEAETVQTVSEEEFLAEMVSEEVKVSRNDLNMPEQSLLSDLMEKVEAFCPLSPVSDKRQEFTVEAPFSPEAEESIAESPLSEKKQRFMIDAPLSPEAEKQHEITVESPLSSEPENKQEFMVETPLSPESEKQRDFTIEAPLSPERETQHLSPAKQEFIVEAVLSSEEEVTVEVPLSPASEKKQGFFVEVNGSSEEDIDEKPAIASGEIDSEKDILTSAGFEEQPEPAVEEPESCDRTELEADKIAITTEHSKLGTIQHFTSTDASSIATVNFKTAHFYPESHPGEAISSFTNPDLITEKALSSDSNSAMNLTADQSHIASEEEPIRQQDSPSPTWSFTSDLSEFYFGKPEAANEDEAMAAEVIKVQRCEDILKEDQETGDEGLIVQSKTVDDKTGEISEAKILLDVEEDIPEEIVFDEAEEEQYEQDFLSDLVQRSQDGSSDGNLDDLCDTESVHVLKKDDGQCDISLLPKRENFMSLAKGLIKPEKEESRVSLQNQLNETKLDEEIEQMEKNKIFADRMTDVLLTNILQDELSDMSPLVRTQESTSPAKAIDAQPSFSLPKIFRTKLKQHEDPNRRQIQFGTQIVTAVGRTSTSISSNNYTNISKGYVEHYVKSFIRCVKDDGNLVLEKCMETHSCYEGQKQFNRMIHDCLKECLERENLKGKGDCATSKLIVDEIMGCLKPSLVQYSTEEEREMASRYSEGVDWDHCNGYSELLIVVSDMLLNDLILELIQNHG